MKLPDVTATSVGTMYTTGITFRPWVAVAALGGSSLVAVLLLGFAGRKPSTARALLAGGPVLVAAGLPLWDSIQSRRSQGVAVSPAKPKPASWVQT